MLSKASKHWFFSQSIQMTNCGTNKISTSPEVKLPTQAWLNMGKNGEQTCTKLAISVHNFSTLSVGKCLCVHRTFESEIRVSSCKELVEGLFPFYCNLSQQLLAFELCSLKSKLNIQRKSSCTFMFIYKGHMLGMQRSKTKAEQEVGG